MVNRDQNLALTRSITMEEVEEVVKGLAKKKTPGLDSFTAELFQVSLRILGKDILEVVEESWLSK